MKNPGAFSGASTGTPMLSPAGPSTPYFYVWQPTFSSPALSEFVSAKWYKFISVLSNLGHGDNWH